MRRFNFTITITGIGATLDDAWREATCTLANQPPYTSNYEENDWKEGEAVGPEMFKRLVAPFSTDPIQHKKFAGERCGKRRLNRVKLVKRAYPGGDREGIYFQIGDREYLELRGSQDRRKD